MLEHSLVHLECLVFWYVFQAVSVLLVFKQFPSVTGGLLLSASLKYLRAERILVSGTAAKIEVY